MKIVGPFLFCIFAAVAFPSFVIAGTEGSSNEQSQVTAPVVSVIGTYRVKKTKQPVVLVELMVTGYVGPLGFSQFGQKIGKLELASDQVAHLEHELNTKGTSGRELSFDPLNVSGSARVAFFLHYPELNKPLLTPFGAVRLPAPTARPKRLNFLRYEEPD